MRHLIFLAAAWAAICCGSPSASHANDCGSRAAVCRPTEYGQPDLFYNYYVDPNCGGIGAQAYLAPHPVPAHVGHVYYTYQPFYPHELLYKHKRVYHKYYDEGRGLTRTSVHWR